jgi:hypothetical protein
VGSTFSAVLTGRECAARANLTDGVGRSPTCSLDELAFSTISTRLTNSVRREAACRGLEFGLPTCRTLRIGSVSGERTGGSCVRVLGSARAVGANTIAVTIGTTARTSLVGYAERTGLASSEHIVRGGSSSDRDVLRGTGTRVRSALIDV